MNSIIQSGPDIPDPTQLTLFDTEVKDAETVQNSTDSAHYSLSTEPLIRSPTYPDEMVLLENGKKFELNHFQKILAGSLLRKSRELVRRSKEINIESQE